MNRDRLELHAAALGQLRGDTSAPITAPTVTAIQQSECAHLLYQATSRAQCRMVDKGNLAKPTAVYFAHQSDDIYEYLRKVTPRAKVMEWERPKRSKRPALVDLAAERIAAVLELRTTPISTKELRHVAGMVGAQGVPKRTYSRAIERALERLRGRWTKEERMLVPTP
jgi:hypothetical protein